MQTLNQLPVHYVWLFWSLFLLVIWLVVFLINKDKKSRREMLVVSLWTTLIGLTEPFFVPEYWNPPSLFNLAEKTGFDIESLIFSFGIGGLAVVLYEVIFKVKHKKVSVCEKKDSRHRFHVLILLASPIIFLLLILFSGLNPIYSACIAMICGGLAALYCRPDLKNKMIVSAFIFMGLYFFYFSTLILVSPGYVQTVWNLSAISGILFLGVPAEELMFAFSFGFLWSSIYEHITWQKIDPSI